MKVGDTLDGYTVTEKLGWGNFSTVWKATNGDKVVAMKVTKSDESYFKMFEEEIEIAKPLDHPNIIKMLDAMKVNGLMNQKHFVVVLDYVDGSDLFCYMNRVMRHRIMAIEDVAYLSRQMFSALEHLADLDIVHCDLKQENIMISKNGVLKIGDFGTAMKVGGRLRKYGHTYSYRSPEVMLGRRFAKVSPASDIWSAAVISFELAVSPNILFPAETELSDSDSNRSSYDDDLNREHLREIVSVAGPFPKKLTKRFRRYFSAKGRVKAPKLPERNLEEELQSERAEVEEDESDGLARLARFVMSCLRYLPSQRPTAKQALAHSFIALGEGREDCEWYWPEKKQAKRHDATEDDDKEQGEEEEGPKEEETKIEETRP